ncbi:MAG: RHS repeat domain-containing protein [Aureispira sp.]
MNYLHKILPVLLGGLFLLCPLILSAQIPTYNLSWYKTSCSTAAGTPTELRVDIEPFAAGTTYVCELYEDLNPSGGQSSNPSLISLLGSYTTSNVDVIIDAFFANAKYKKSYYVKVYPTGNLSQSRVQYIDVQRLIPSAGSYVTNVNYDVSTTPEFCNPSAVNMDILLTTIGTTVGHLYTWTSPTGATIATPNSQNPTVPIYINGNSGPKHQYQVQINDVAGCDKVIHNIEYNPPQPFTGLSVAIKPFGFFSPECGDIAAEVLNTPIGTSYIYEWYNSNGSLYQRGIQPQIQGLKPSSSYFVRLKTPAGCLLQTLPSFQTPDAINCTIGTITGDPCVGGTAADITVEATFGTAPYTYEITGTGSNNCTTTLSNASSLVTIGSMTCNSSLTPNIPVGAYEVKVTDHYGCQFTKQIQVGQNINDLAMEIMTVDEVCDGNDGSFRLEANNYTGALQFTLVAWSGGTPLDLNHLYNPTINVQNGSYELVGIPAGTYTVDISLSGFNNYCNRTEVITINNEGISIASTQISSAQGNANRGVLFLDVVGAPIRDIQFNWTSTNTNNPYGSTHFGGLGVNELSELGAGTYTVTITYEDCEITQTFVVPFCALVANEFTRNDYCQLHVGVAGVNVLDNGLDVTGQANYQWEQISPNYRPLPNTNNVVNDLEAGTYDVTVTYGGCSIVEQVVLLDFSFPSSASKVDAYCGGDNGSANYDFSFLDWSFQSTSINWTNANTNQPLAPGVGTIFNYPAGRPATGTTGENLPVGAYFINVDLTSNAGRTCRHQILVKINPNSTLPNYTITTSPSLCGSSNGIVAVQGVNYPAGQVPTYTWTPLAPLTGGPYIGGEIKNLMPGDYQLDAIYAGRAACNYTKQVTLPNIEPTLAIDYIQNEGCGGKGEFGVSTNLENTHHNYEYLVTDDQTNLVLARSSNGVFTNMPPGNYTVSINTGNPDCPPKSVSITIERSELVVTNQQNATCGTGGALEVDLQDANGQALPANNSDFVWSNGIQNRVNNNLTQGTYTITVTQSNGVPCVATFLVVNNPLILTNEAIVPACTGANGSISLTTNDVGAVNYTWSNGASGSSISGLSPGEYEVTITGANNGNGTCVLYQSYTIHGGFDLVTNAEDVLCNGDNDGKVRALVSNTKAPITSYAWSNGVYSPNQNNLSAGTYTVTVTDANSCTQTSSATINTPTALLINNFQPYGGTDPQITCGGEVQVSGGTAPYVVAWQLLQIEQQDDGTGNLVDVVIGGIETAHTQIAQAGTNTIENKLAPGVYSILVTDNKGCQIASTFTIEIAAQTTALPTMYFRWEQQQDDGDLVIGTTTTADGTEQKAKVIADNMETQIKAAVDQFSDALNKNSCDQVDNIADATKLSYALKYHHYTLYYYNRRGELTRTVPPAGVDFLTSAEVNAHKEYRANQTTTLPSKELPQHTLITTYHYDAAGRSIASVSPDAGLVEQTFRSDGLVRFSQDARQKAFATERMTYIKYDNLNRVIEQGELEVPNGLTYTAYIAGQGQIDKNTLDFPQDIATLIKTEWVKTHYSEKHVISSAPTVYATYHGLGTEEQNYLRNRVSYTETWNGGSNTNAITTTTYSYDPHGNVEWLRNYVPGLGDNYIRLEYDLISRNVNKVCYNEWALDRFYHRYEYDEQNRITKVETSNNDLVWDSDAQYAYYEHGPLKRKELGEDKIQGLDYTYTIHGWLKAINHPYLTQYENANSTNNQLNDPGQDGYATSPNNEVLQDVWGFSLGYYQGDYARQSTQGAGNYNSISEAINYNSQELYNGNITYWSNGTSQNSLVLGDQEKLTQRSFTYDNLNRILGSTLNIVNLGNSPTFGATTNQFRTAYSYDANGNINTLQRYDGNNNGQLIDDLSYQYNTNGAGQLINNQLASIQDAVGSTTNLGDIDNQSYVYDARGSIIQIVEPNSTNNKTTDITWLNTGKVKTVSIKEEVNGTLVEISHLEYLYDATGNRVAKLWKADVSDPVTWQNTYYVNDVSGNKMSIYERGYEYRAGHRNAYRTYYRLKEQLLYGSDRLGTRKGNIRLFNNKYTGLPEELYAGWDINTKVYAANTNPFVSGRRLLGRKEYDLTDHLGNVTTQLSDRKTGTLFTNDIQAQVLSYQQYFPFGWNQPGRSVNSDKARFGFNGKEDDEELSNGSQDFGARYYDARVGRWWGIDPLSQKFTEWSPYNFVTNNPINIIDPDGRDTFLVRRSAHIVSLSDDLAKVSELSFYIIKNGVETKLSLPNEEVVYMLNNAGHNDRDDNGLTQKEFYKLRYDQMSEHANWVNTIRVTEDGVFIHQARNISWVSGCRGVCTEYEIDEDWGFSTKKSNSIETLFKIRNLYDTYEDQLSGDKFLLQITESRAPSLPPAKTYTYDKGKYKSQLIDLAPAKDYNINYTFPNANNTLEEDNN